MAMISILLTAIGALAVSLWLANLGDRFRALLDGEAPGDGDAGAPFPLLPGDAAEGPIDALRRDGLL